MSERVAIPSPLQVLNANNKQLDFMWCWRNRQRIGRRRTCCNGHAPRQDVCCFDVCVMLHFVLYYVTLRYVVILRQIKHCVCGRVRERERERHSKKGRASLCSSKKWGVINGNDDDVDDDVPQVSNNSMECQRKCEGERARRCLEHLLISKQ